MQQHIERWVKMQMLIFVFFFLFLCTQSWKKGKCLASGHSTVHHILCISKPPRVSCDQFYRLLVQGEFKLRIYCTPATLHWWLTHHYHNPIVSDGRCFLWRSLKNPPYSTCLKQTGTTSNQLVNIAESLGSTKPDVPLGRDSKGSSANQRLFYFHLANNIVLEEWWCCSISLMIKCSHTLIYFQPLINFIYGPVFPLYSLGGSTPTLHCSSAAAKFHTIINKNGHLHAVWAWQHPV